MSHLKFFAVWRIQHCFDFALFSTTIQVITNQMFNEMEIRVRGSTRQGCVISAVACKTCFPCDKHILECDSKDVQVSNIF